LRIDEPMEQMTGTLGHEWEEMARRSWNGSRDKGKRRRAEHSVREEERRARVRVRGSWERYVAGLSLFLCSFVVTDATMIEPNRVSAVSHRACAPHGVSEHGRCATSGGRSLHRPATAPPAAATKCRSSSAATGAIGRCIRLCVTSSARTRLPSPNSLVFGFLRPDYKDGDRNASSRKVQKKAGTLSCRECVL
jgi:hypothetical protein